MCGGIDRKRPFVDCPTWTDGHTEKITLEVVRYRDKDGKPTCARDFKAGEVCEYYRVHTWGTIETCLFSPACRGLGEALERRGDDRLGTLIPMDGCPLWRDEKK